MNNFVMTSQISHTKKKIGYFFMGSLLIFECQIALSSPSVMKGQMPPKTEETND